jgi:hypothetical protein
VCLAAVRKQPTTVANDDGADLKVEFVDEVAFEHPTEQLAAAVDLQLAPGRRLELAHGRLDIAVDDVGVLPGRVLEAGRWNVLGQHVDAVRYRVTLVMVRPIGLKDLPGSPPRWRWPRRGRAARRSRRNGRRGGVDASISRR